MMFPIQDKEIIQNNERSEAKYEPNFLSEYQGGNGYDISCVL